MKTTQTAEITVFKRLLQVNNVVRRTQIPARTLRHWAATGQIPAVRLGQKIWGFDPDRLDAIVERRRNHERF